MQDETGRSNAAAAGDYSAVVKPTHVDLELDAAAPSALTIKGQRGDASIEIAAPSQIVHEAALWAHSNPIEFIAVVVLLAWWIAQRRAGKRERARDRLEFDQLRRNIREAPKGRKGRSP